MNRICSIDCKWKFDWQCLKFFGDYSKTIGDKTIYFKCIQNENVRKFICVLGILCESKNEMFCVLVCLLACFLCSVFFSSSSISYSLSLSLCCALVCVKKNDVLYLLLRIYIERRRGRDGKDVVVAYARLQNARKHFRMNGANILWIKFHLMCACLYVCVCVFSSFGISCFFLFHLNCYWFI